MSSEEELQERVIILESRNSELEEALRASKQETRDVKAKAVSVARKYAQRHNWCREVERAIEEAGLGRTYKRVEVQVQMPTTVLLDVDAEEFAEMSEEERATFIQGNITMSSGVQAKSESIRIQQRGLVYPSAVQVQSIGEPTPPAPPGPSQAPPGYVERYSSDDGRVKHFFRQNEQEFGQVRRDNGYTGSLCGQVDFVYYATLRETSQRGENRTCSRCIQAAARMTITN